MAADLISHDPPVIQVQDCTQIYLMYFHAYIVLKFCDIRQPLLVRGVRMEIPVQIVLRYVGWIAAFSRAAFWLPLDRKSVV